MAGRRDEGHVSDILAEVFRRGGMKRAVKRAEVVLLWPQVVGPDVARFAEAMTLRDGVLFVSVPDSETSMHLSLQRQLFVDVYRGKFGVKEIRDIHFRVGKRPSEPKPAPVPQARADPKELARLARELGTLDLPDSLSGSTMQVAKAMLDYRARMRAKGWTPCPLCGTLSEDPEMCDTCQRYALEPKVGAGARRLAVDPRAATPLLSEDERAVATHLAIDYLDQTLAELLPQVLAEPKLKSHLERAARCRLALELDKAPEALENDDFQRLDPRISRALGRWH